ncbi:MAG: hypothetical protein R3Y12_09220 [Clostridia bacterium]
MNETILKAIFDGNFLIWEEKYIKTKITQELLEKINKNRAILTENMNLNEKSHFEDYECLLNALSAEQNSFSKYNSFILGIIVGLEISEHKNGLFEDLQ